MEGEFSLSINENPAKIEKLERSRQASGQFSLLKKDLGEFSLLKKDLGGFSPLKKDFGEFLLLKKEKVALGKNYGEKMHEKGALGFTTEHI